MFSLLYAWLSYNSMLTTNNFLTSSIVVRQLEKIRGQDNAANNKNKSLKKKWNSLN